MTFSDAVFLGALRVKVYSVYMYLKKLIKANEPQHEKAYLLPCVPNSFKLACISVQSDQSSLFTWRNFASLDIQNVPSEDSDQTAQMQSLIRIFPGQTCLKVFWRCSSNVFCIIFFWITLVSLNWKQGDTNFFSQLHCICLNLSATQLKRL